MDDSSNGRAFALYPADPVQIPAPAPYEFMLLHQFRSNLK